MSRRAKLIERMRRTPRNIHFRDVASLLKYEGFVLFNARGSHRMFHHFDGRVLTVVVPHGKRKSCHPADVQRILEVLGL